MLNCCLLKLALYRKYGNRSSWIFTFVKVNHKEDRFNHSNQKQIFSITADESLSIPRLIRKPKFHLITKNDKLGLVPHFGVPTKAGPHCYFCSIFFFFFERNTTFVVSYF